jgi:uncharacterized protein YfaQ (DUF2300 family)
MSDPSPVQTFCEAHQPPHDECPCCLAVERDDKLQQAQATIPHLQALVKSGDLKRVLDAAQQHANDEQAWRSVWGPAYFESNLGRCENRRKLRVAIQELAALLSAIPAPREEPR